MFTCAPSFYAGAYVSISRYTTWELVLVSYLGQSSINEKLKDGSANAVGWYIE